DPSQSLSEHVAERGQAAHRRPANLAPLALRPALRPSTRSGADSADVGTVPVSRWPRPGARSTPIPASTGARTTAGLALAAMRHGAAGGLGRRLGPVYARGAKSRYGGRKPTATVGGPVYRSILLPLDGSEFAAQAVPLALEIARRADAVLHPVHVY